MYHMSLKLEEELPWKDLTSIWAVYEILYWYILEEILSKVIAFSRERANLLFIA